MPKTHTRLILPLQDVIVAQWKRVLLLLSLSFCVAPSTLLAADNPKAFGKGAPFTAEDLPAGKLKDKLSNLSPKAKQTAMEWLHSFQFPAADAASELRVDKAGGVLYACGHSCKTCSHSEGPEAANGADDIMADPDPTSGSVPISSPPAFHSKPGSPNVIYLDFNGGIVSGTAWNNSSGVSSYDTQAWSRDSDRTTFSDSEQIDIRRIWERMAEDFAPFDINITTDTAYDPDNYTGDRSRVGWCIFTPSQDKNGVSNPHSGYGGIAYVNVFGRSDYGNYSPAWCQDYGQANAAEVGSHEMGHNLGLSHDGTASVTYYSGHGSGDTRWGPIMGSSYGESVSQWSKGEYYNANQTQDDLAIISNKTGYRVDDHGDTNGTASAVSVAGDGTFSESGIISTTGETDVFSIPVSNAGTVSINGTPFYSDSGSRGNNLDVKLELYDGNANLVASANPASTTSASIHIIHGCCMPCAAACAIQT